MLRKAIQFITTDLWRIRLKHYKRGHSFLINQLRIIVLTIRGYMQDKCQLRASALTYYTLLSIVPLIAMMFGVAKGFGLQKRVENQIKLSLQGQEEVTKWLIDFANKLLNETSGGLIAGLGVVILLYTIIKLLGNIEHSFNDIWGIKQSRHWGRKITDYLAVMLVCPIFLVVSSSATVVIGGQLLKFTENTTALSSLEPIIRSSLKLASFGMVWVLFSFLYLFMPNTRVKWRAGVPAGIIAGTLFQIVQGIYVSSQAGLARYNTIYGSIAALPFFIFWLQISWLIVLFGAELSFANQNVETYEFEPDCLSLSPAFRKELSLLISQRIVKNFCNGQDPMTTDMLAHELDLPIRLVRDLTWQLVQCNIIALVKTEDDKKAAYLPAKDVSKLTIAAVVDALDQIGENNLPIADNISRQQLNQKLHTLRQAMHSNDANALLRDL